MKEVRDQKITVLAVDDTPENLDVIKGILVPKYRVKSAINGKTALKIAQNQPPDIILLDIMMPEMNGYEVCRILKESPVTRDIPVIFVTAMGEELDELHGFSLGAVDYVKKPISTTVLKARVDVHVALRQAKKELQIKNGLLQEERELVEDIVSKMRTDPHFDPKNIRFSVESLEKTNGDVFFTAFRPDGAQHLLLGDFTGHGLKAAIGGPLVAAFFYIRTHNGVDGETILRELNDILFRQLPTDMFMGAALVEITPERDRFRLWNSALPDQVLIPDRNSDPIYFPSSVPALGIMGELRLRKCEWVEWGEMARLYLYTDGLVEPLDQEGVMFGSSRLGQLLREPWVATSGLEKIFERVMDFSVEGEMEDDITFVEVKR